MSQPHLSNLVHGHRGVVRNTDRCKRDAVGTNNFKTPGVGSNVGERVFPICTDPRG